MPPAVVGVPGVATGAQLVVEIPNGNEVNHLIGVKGVTINALQQETSTHISVQRASEVPPGFNVRQVTITGGTELQRARCAELVRAKVLEFTSEKSEEQPEAKRRRTISGSTGAPPAPLGYQMAPPGQMYYGMAMDPSGFPATIAVDPSAQYVQYADPNAQYTGVADPNAAYQYYMMPPSQTFVGQPSSHPALLAPAPGMLAAPGFAEMPGAYAAPPPGAYVGGPPPS